MKIAIIGTGIAGNSAAWLLNQGFDITVFEQNSKIGGHANTVSGDHPDVDTGFIVYNEWTYPNLIALFDHLNVETVKTDMSFAASVNNGQIEYSGDSIFGQRSNLFSLSFYRMLIDILRFYKTAPKAVQDNEGLSLGAFLADKNYSKSFIDHHILPMAAAIWSTASDDVRNFPLKSFVQFFVNHGLFRLMNRPQWYTVKGGSKNYVQKITENHKQNIRLNTAIKSIKREDDYVVLTTDKGEKEKFDHVVLACHTDQALEILSDPNQYEHDVLKAFPYAENTAYLHTDDRFMPKRKNIWSSWNYIQTDNKDHVCVTYWMNKLQSFIGHDQDYLVTLNPPEPPAKDKVLNKMVYHHPQYTMAALKGWDMIKMIQGKRRTWFCGAWCGYGFHEDGISSGLSVAESLSEILGSTLKRPWIATEKSPAGENAKPTSDMFSS